MAGATVACVLAGALGGPASAATNEEARAEVADLDPSARVSPSLPQQPRSHVTLKDEPGKSAGTGFPLDE